MPDAGQRQGSDRGGTSYRCGRNRKVVSAEMSTLFRFIEIGFTDARLIVAIFYVARLRPGFQRFNPI